MDYEVYWHSSAHVLAAAVKRLWPDVKLGIGPAIEKGFYYEFYGRTFSKEDLERIEEEMRKIIKEDPKFIRKEISKKEAEKLFKDEPFKLELLRKMEGEKVSIYETGDFVDLCKGPHLRSAGEIKHVKLLRVNAAYWLGDEKNPMMQRIYGISFKTKKEMEEFLRMLEEAEKRDHRKIGKQLDLFGLYELVGPGLPILHPKGMTIRKELVKLMREVNDRLDFQEVYTPHVAKCELWRRSGHYEAYKENMFIFKVNKEEWGIKAMNCPFHIQVYKSRARSYRDLPVRYSEFATVYRREKSGELSGLLRVISLTQDDHHIFAREDQIKEEVEKLVRASIDVLKGIFKMRVKVKLSTKPEKHIGSDEIWEKATNALKSCLEEMKVEYELKEGEGAFYGPKIDFDAMDSLGRWWQLTTIQLDFFMPQRFELEYVDKDGSKRRPVMIHWALLGSLERFMGVMIEHYAGKFPLWLSPVQVRVLPITDRNVNYGRKVWGRLKSKGIRAELDDSRNTLQYKIREAQLQKIPYMVIVGDKEEKGKSIAVRDRSGKTKYGVKLNDFIKDLLKKIEERSV